MQQPRDALVRTCEGMQNIRGCRLPEISEKIQVEGDLQRRIKHSTRRN